MSKKVLGVVAIVIIAVAVSVGVSFSLFSKAGNGSKPSEVYSLETADMYSNVKDSRRIVKIKIVVETNNEKDLAELDKKKYQIRDISNEIIRATPEKDLVDVDSQNKLREKIKKQLIEEMGINSITNVRFNDFVIQ